MMYPGLYILAGAPKIGKSWLALDLCMSVANGEQFLKHDTNTGQVLYLSLEDNLLRLQNRIYELTDEPCENLNFAIEAKSIGNGLEEELEKSKQQLLALARSVFTVIILFLLLFLYSRGKMSMEDLFIVCAGAVFSFRECNLE